MINENEYLLKKENPMSLEPLQFVCQNIDMSIELWPMKNEYLLKKENPQSLELSWYCVSRHWHVYWTMINENEYLLKKEKYTESRTTTWIS